MTPVVAADTTAEIRRMNDLFASHFERGDAAAIAGLYTSAGVLMPTGSESVQGSAGIEAFWQGAMAMGLKQLQLKTREIQDLGSTAIEVGNYTLYGPESQAVDQGKYLVVWKQDRGQWKLHQDIWNSSVAPPAQ